MDIADADARLTRFASYLKNSFSDYSSNLTGIIESPYYRKIPHMESLS